MSIEKLGARLAELLDEDQFVECEQLLLSIRARIAELEAAQNASDVRDQVVVDRFVQPVADHCDRITWRGNYYRLPIAAAQSGEVAALPLNIVMALRFYANGDHFIIDDDQFDTVSDEPQNWLCSEREDDETMIEDWSVARLALQGVVCGWKDGGEDVSSAPIDGEVLTVAQPPTAHIDAMRLALGALRAGTTINEVSEEEWPEAFEAIAALENALQGFAP